MHKEYIPLSCRYSIHEYHLFIGIPYLFHNLDLLYGKKYALKVAYRKSRKHKGRTKMTEKNTQNSQHSLVAAAQILDGGDSYLQRLGLEYMLTFHL